MNSKQSAYYFAQPYYIIFGVTVFLSIWFWMVYGGGSELIMLVAKVELPIARVVALIVTLAITATYSALFYRARPGRTEEKK